MTMAANAPVSAVIAPMVMRDQLRTYSLTTIGAMTALTGAFAAIVTIVR